jgi:proline dehydrogenase
MLRNTFLYLSTQRQLRRWMETSRFAKPLTRRFIAGQTLADAVAASRRVNAGGYLVALDPLGENVSTEAEAASARDNAVRAAEAVRESGLRATVSIKLTQFGLDLSDSLCRENVAAVVAAAQASGTRIEFDMESSAYTSRTLDIVTSLHRRFGCVRAVIQAYLHRSEDDIQALNAERVPVRLCKGAYNESPEVAVQSKEQVDQRYLSLAELLLMDGTDPAFATHDEQMMAPAMRVEPAKFEFQMLYGVRRELQRRVLAGGYRLRVYVPYGTAWYPYFMRRLAERPANAWFVARSVLGG